MNNSLYATLGGVTQRNMGNYGKLIQDLNNFMKTFSGDPKQQVQNLLNSGRVTQEQYNQAVQMANQLQSLFK